MKLPEGLHAVRRNQPANQETNTSTDQLPSQPINQ